MENKHLFPYDWRLSDGYPAKGITRHGCKVFGTFVCGGGSTMGYKLAGYDHLGGVELDPKVADTYQLNHHPRHFYTMDIRDFNRLDNLPSELYDLDILDGSPPCSTFSMAGSREKAWGKEKKFAEGQKKQTLDDLVFVYCDTIAKLKPKVCLLENVAGIVAGNAKAYAREIFNRITSAGYRVQIFKLNAATMGVPQTRQRVFFIGLRDDFATIKPLQLDFGESPILFGDVMDDSDTTRTLSEYQYRLWRLREPADRNFSDIKSRTEGKNSMFNHILQHKTRVSPTYIASSWSSNSLFDIPRRTNREENRKIATFPADYDYGGCSQNFICGMSVPPVMTAQIAWQIWRQWLRYICTERVREGMDV